MAATSADSTVPIERRPTALIAESDRAMRELLAVHLQNAGYTVLVAPDAMVAGRMVVQDSDAIDVMIVNAHLPYMTGIEFVSTLIADSSLRFIPTVVVASNEEQARRVDVLGVPCLIAPFSTGKLLEAVRSATIAPGAPDHGRSEGIMRKRLDVLAKARAPSIPLRIVVADDEADTVTSLMAVLVDEGHSVFGTHSATDVLPEVKLNKPDAVILDIDMPKISGFAIARDIRESFGDRAPLLIAVSGKWIGQTDRMLAELAGFDYFLQKPCHPDALIALLARGRQAEKNGFTCGPSLTFQT